MRLGLGEIGLSALVCLVLVYLLFPVVVVVAISFSSAAYLSFPPPGFSLRWFARIFSNWSWVNSFWLTMKVSGLTTILATLMGVPAAFALSRHAIRGKNLINALLLAALITPPVIKAIRFTFFMCR